MALPGCGVDLSPAGIASQSSCRRRDYREDQPDAGDGSARHGRPHLSPGGGDVLDRTPDDV
jgi:hypothetical protein